MGGAGRANATLVTVPGPGSGSPLAPASFADLGSATAPSPMFPLSRMRRSGWAFLEALPALPN